MRVDGEEGLPMLGRWYLSSLKHDGHPIIVRCVMTINEILDSLGQRTVFPRQVSEHRDDSDCRRSDCISIPTRVKEEEG